MEVKALKDLHGTIEAKAGETVTMNEEKANFHAKLGNVELIKTKELKLKKEDA